MRGWFSRMLERIRDRLSLAYGNDEINLVLNILSFILCLASFIPKLSFLFYIALAILIYTTYRALSKNIYKRQSELDRYLRLKNRASKKIQFYKLVFKERKDYVYFKCPKCKAILRVPRHRGEIVVTCRECGEKFDKKT